MVGEHPPRLGTACRSHAGWPSRHRAHPEMTRYRTGRLERELLPDAPLGALAYLAEIVLSLVGGEERWRTAPWTVLALGFVISCGAAASVLPVIVQAVLGAWCTPCLVSASSRSRSSGVARRSR